MQNFEHSFSTNKISFVKINNKYYIKKRTKFLDKREIQSINKQNIFQPYFLDDYEVRAAKITFDLNKDKKNFFYLVDYYSGKNGGEVLLTGNITEIKILSKFLLNNYFNSEKNFFYQKISKYIFLQKIEEIEKKLNNKNFIFFKKQIINKAKKIFSEDALYPVNKFCHGDLTLSNIIIDSEKKLLVLFDFQKTYNDNIIQDYSKIYQDIILNWTARRFAQKDRARVDIVYENLIPKVKWKEMDIRLCKAIKKEIIMTLLRILPYICSEDILTLKWVENNFKKIV